MTLLYDSNFGEIVQKIRKRKQLTQIEVVAKMQTYGSMMSNDTDSKIERGLHHIFVEDFVILNLVLGTDYKNFSKNTRSE